jgi:hypothetical protein
MALAAGWQNLLRWGENLRGAKTCVGAKTRVGESKLGVRPQKKYLCTNARIYVAGD